MTARLGALLALAVLVAALGLRGALPPFDDAFFFLRFARHTVEAGVPAWNLPDGPVHGNTSQLQQGLATVGHFLLPGHGIAWARAWALLALAGGGALLARHRAPEGVALALLGPVGLATLTTGMETALVLGLGAAFLHALARPGRDGALAGLAALLYLARPDTGLLTVGTLLLQRRGRAAGGALAAIAGLLVGLALVYGDPLPTAFLTKLAVGEGVYGPAFRAASAVARQRHGLLFLWVVAPLVLAPRERDEWPLAGVALAFVGYHLLFTVDVMGMHARFFAPALPWLVPRARPTLQVPVALAWLALGGAALAQRAVPDASGWAIGQVVPATWFAYAVAASLVGRAPWPAVPAALLVGVLAWPAHRGVPWRDDATHVATYASQVNSFKGLGIVARCLPADATVLHSEIGVPGMVLPDARIVDLGGLMAPGWTPETADARCEALAPDAVFLPHPNYARLRAALADGRCLDRYALVLRETSSPLYVRADHRDAVLPCL